MHLIPIVTELQCNIVEDILNINTRKTVFRIRINGNIGWLDMLQGIEFVPYLLDNYDDFSIQLKSYNVDYLEANVSDEVLALLQRALRNIRTVSILENTSKITNIKMNHIRIKL